MSMMLNSLPSPQQQIESLQRELHARSREAMDLKEELRQERAGKQAVEVGVQQLRKILGPLHHALRLVFEESADIAGAAGQYGGDSATSGGGGGGVDPRKQAIWDAWKSKLGGQVAKAIDALLLHGELTQTQLRIHVGCARGSTASIVHQLNRAALINKRDGRVSLKDL